MSRRGGDSEEISLREFTENVLFALSIGLILLAISMTAFPVWTRRIWATGVNLLGGFFIWSLAGSTGTVLIWGFVIVGWILIIGSAYLVMEKIYSWSKSRFKDDDLVNEYQIK